MGRYNFNYSKEEMIELADAWCNEILTKPNKNMFLETHVNLPKENIYTIDKKELVIVDIGGSFLKICVIRVCLTGDFEYILPVERYSMKEYSHSNTSIWVWIANLLKKTLTILPKKEYLGSLTISYPVNHTSLNSGVILDCGKNFPFDKNTFIGADPVKSINKACFTKNVPISFKSIMNDATATALASYFTDKCTVLGIVLGTGTNGAIIVDKGDHKTIINSEWASFSHPSIKLTVFDEIICNNMSENEVYYNLLDVLLGGYKLVEICRLFCKYKGCSNSNSITLETMLIALFKDSEDRTKREEVIAKCFYEIKLRTYQILASLILGTLKALNLERKHVSVCLNGSIFEHSEDRIMLHEEFVKLCVNDGQESNYEVKWSFIPDGSLVGCAFSTFLE
ncbi:hypothetical protein TUBRATIS_30830 [Tubulinosema ratisbonensis]|uniref:Phosphotransferase n=1 Tax=Tubulinosema ratisbonensis TaxID=291195 RepID=A0A437AH52_9MICR|nr:hypothetical protein TUBRATIS_30830 [Tubulinosema ratisbonensis]